MTFPRGQQGGRCWPSPSGDQWEDMRRWKEAASGEVQTEHQEKLFHWEDGWVLEQHPQGSGCGTKTDSSNSVWMMLSYILVLDSPMRSRELGWMILMGPFPFEISYDLQSLEHFLLALWRHCYYRNKTFPWRKWAVWKATFADPTLIIILERQSNLQPIGYEEVMLLGELAGLTCSFPSFACW